MGKERFDEILAKICWLFSITNYCLIPRSPLQNHHLPNPQTYQLRSQKIRKPITQETYHSILSNWALSNLGKVAECVVRKNVTEDDGFCKTFYSPSFDSIKLEFVMEIVVKKMNRFKFGVSSSCCSPRGWGTEMSQNDFTMRLYIKNLIF